jgi:hypothetical protein
MPPAPRGAASEVGAGARRAGPRVEPWQHHATPGYEHISRARVDKRFTDGYLPHVVGFAAQVNAPEMWTMRDASTTHGSPAW